MLRRDADEPVVIVQERTSDVGSFLFGIAIGAGVALLLAPRSGAEVRKDIGRRVQKAKGDVADTFADAREKVEERLERARALVEKRRRQVADAVEAGRTAARDAHQELNHRLGDARAQAADEV
jgi:gas vesicle protein